MNKTGMWPAEVGGQIAFSFLARHCATHCDQQGVGAGEARDRSKWHRGTPDDFPNRSHSGKVVDHRPTCMIGTLLRLRCLRMVSLPFNGGSGAARKRASGKSCFSPGKLLSLPGWDVSRSWDGSAMFAGYSSGTKLCVAGAGTGSSGPCSQART